MDVKLPGHAVRRDRAMPGARRQGQDARFARRRENAGRAQGARARTAAWSWLRIISGRPCRPARPWRSPGIPAATRASITGHQRHAEENRGGGSRVSRRAPTATWRRHSSPRSSASRPAYELPLLAHATMEPMNCTADVKANGCDLYVGTQVQQVAQITAAAAAGLKPAQVRVHTTLLGRRIRPAAGH